MDKKWNLFAKKNPDISEDVRQQSKSNRKNSKFEYDLYWNQDLLKLSFDGSLPIFLFSYGSKLKMDARDNY
jgi:hypothetical protein